MHLQQVIVQDILRLNLALRYLLSFLLNIFICDMLPISWLTNYGFSSSFTIFIVLKSHD